MSPINSKRKGSDFERSLVKLLSEKVNHSTWKRIPTSGAIGSRSGIPALFSDIVGNIPGIKRQVRVEAKIGYGGALQLTLKKEWLDKIAKEAQSTYSLPILIGKFSGSRDGITTFAVLPLDVLIYLFNIIEENVEKG